jgi:hypothetical protein
MTADLCEQLSFVVWRRTNLNQNFTYSYPQNMEWIGNPSNCYGYREPCAPGRRLRYDSDDDDDDDDDDADDDAAHMEIRVDQHFNNSNNECCIFTAYWSQKRASVGFANTSPMHDFKNLILDQFDWFWGCYQVTHPHSPQAWLGKRPG